jgi:DNA-directed RNA polymerase subunit beta
VVINSDGTSIEIYGDDGKTYVYQLDKFYRSNQGTCINQRPLVKKGDIVSTDTIIADSSSTDKGQLALGQNLIVAFMSWEGYNYEDAIILNEKLVKNDRFTSIHIEKHEIEARDTKLGPEEITRDIPNIGEEALRDLDEEGIIRIGAEVEPGDILVGKITPKGETELSAEEKLLRAIFGEKARDVKDSSLRVPHGQRGKVISVRIIEKSENKSIAPGINKIVRVWLAQTRKISVGDKMAGRHGNKGVISVILPEEDMPFLPDGTPVDIILNPIGVSSRMNLGQILETHLGLAAGTIGIQAKAPVFSGQNIIAIEDMLARIWIINQANKNFGPLSINRENYTHIEENSIKDWLNSKNQDYDKVFGTNYPGEARDACLRVWLKDEQGIDTTNLSIDEIDSKVFLLNQQQNIAAPTLGKSVLYDGKTGEQFDQPITVGYIYMMKLSHLVEDKVHARSTGPYSLITQQPLGGKAQFGGQRFGEMEVWALEAYSAAHNLQEILTVKSDDVIGRVKTYEAIVKGESVSSPGLPESFRVLLKELQSLGLSIELMQTNSGDIGITDLDNDLSLSYSDKKPEISLVKNSSKMDVDKELQALIDSAEIADDATETEPSLDESADALTEIADDATETKPSLDESVDEITEIADDATETEPSLDESANEITEK